MVVALIYARAVARIVVYLVAGFDSIADFVEAVGVAGVAGIVEIADYVAIAGFDETVDFVGSGDFVAAD